MCVCVCVCVSVCVCVCERNKNIYKAYVRETNIFYNLRLEL